MIQPIYQPSNEEKAVQELTKLLLEELLARKWGTGRIEFSAQNGKIVSVRKSIETVVQMKRG